LIFVLNLNKEKGPWSKMEEKFSCFQRKENRAGFEI